MLNKAKFKETHSEYNCGFCLFFFVAFGLEELADGCSIREMVSELKKITRAKTS